MADYVLNEDQEKWLHELETTDKEQGVGALRTHNDKYCCLGIAEELLGYSDVDYNKESQCYFYGGRKLGLTHTTNHKLRLRANQGVFPVTHEVREYLGMPDNGISTNISLSYLNDKIGLTFKEIATFIRKFPHLVFK